MSFLEGMNVFNCACLKQINIEKNICLSYNNVKPNKNSKIQEKTKSDLLNLMIKTR